MFVSIPRFYGSSYPLELGIMLISYYIMVISKMAAKMAALTLKLAYLLNIYSKLVVKMSITGYFGDTSICIRLKFIY